jgi:O-antigen ligase
VRVILGGGSLTVAYGIARPFFPEHNTYGAFLAMIFPLGLVRTLESRGRERLLYGGAVLAMGLGLLLSYTRAALLSLAIVIPIMLALWAMRRGTLKPLLWLALVAVILAASLLATGVATRLQRHMATTVQAENVSNLERINRWMAAAEMVRAKPLIGVGYNAFSREYQAYRRKKIFTELVYKKIDTHSEPLRLLAETGVLGFGAAVWFLGAVVSLAFRSFRAPDREVSALGLALVAGLGTILVHGCFNSYGSTDKVVIPFWTLIGGIAALGRHDGVGSGGLS